METAMSYETILVETKGAVTLITLNRPQALNALNSQVLADLKAFAAFDADSSQRCAVLTGSEKAFAAGADIKEMQSQSFADMYGSNFFAGYDQVTATRKPWIAAVAGWALGGGCELAMMADFIIAADSAKFGQPEIKLAVTPGMGGSQRLTRAVGKAKAMEMCLTGPQHGCCRSRSLRPCRARGAAADLARRSLEISRSHCRHGSARRDWRARKWSTPRLKRRCNKASSSNAACSTVCSAAKTRRKAWPPSWKSAPGTGPGGKCPNTPCCP
jgi:enoyl-CoA hydratase